MDKILNKIKNNKQLVFSIFGIFVLLVLCIGISFAAYNFTNTSGANNEVDSGYVSMTYIEQSNEYVVENALPVKDGEAIGLSDYFEFRVTTSAKTNSDDDNGVSLPYEITIVESEGNTLSSDKIKMYLTEVEGENEVEAAPVTFISDLEPSIYKNVGKKAGFNLHVHRNGNETVTTKYRLRAWIDYNVDVSNWDTTGEFVYKFRVNVNGESAYQGFSTAPSCFAYELNDNNNYSITGYDFASCDNKKIIVPASINNVKVDTISSFANITAAAVSDYKDINSVNDLNNVIGGNKTNLTTIADETFVIDGLIIPEDITVVADAFSTIRVNNVFDASGNFPSSCFKYTASGSSITIKDYFCGGVGRVVIPAKIDNFSVTSIGKSAFYSSQIKSLFIPDTVTSIGTLAFADSQIEFVSFSKNLKSIGGMGFHGNLLKSVFLPDSLTSFGSAVFQENLISEFKLPNNMTTIPERLFSDNQLTSIEIPDHITTIGNNAFEKNQLTSLVIPDNVTAVNNSAFRENKLTSVTISNNIKSLGSYAFENNQLTSVIIPEGVSDIGASAFENNLLTSISFPSSVVSLGESAFEGNKITSLVIPENIISIDKYVFRNNLISYLVLHDNLSDVGSGVFDNNKLKEVTIPSAMTVISSAMFANNLIEKVNFHDNVTEIGLAAFSKNKLKSITLPKNLTTIATRAFEYNDLSVVTIPGSVTKVGRQTFLKTDTSNPNLTKIINKTGLGLEWYNAINTKYSTTKVVTGTISNDYGNVKITAS